MATRNVTFNMTSTIPRDVMNVAFTYVVETPVNTMVAYIRSFMTDKHWTIDSVTQA